MPAWIHDRAEHILAKNPSMSKSTAFAIATQQAHATGKSPKGFGTAKGRQEAKQKYNTPKDDKKTANPGSLESTKLAACLQEIGYITLDQMDKSAMSSAATRALIGGGIGAGLGAGGGYLTGKALEPLPMPGEETPSYGLRGALIGAGVGALAGGALGYHYNPSAMPSVASATPSVSPVSINPSVASATPSVINPAVASATDAPASATRAIHDLRMPGIVSDARPTVQTTDLGYMREAEDLIRKQDAAARQANNEADLVNTLFGMKQEGKLRAPSLRARIENSPGAIVGPKHKRGYLARRGMEIRESLARKMGLRGEDAIHASLGKYGSAPVSREEAQDAMQRLESLQQQKPSGGKLLRYAGIGAVAGPAIGVARNLVSGGRHWSGVSGNALASMPKWKAVSRELGSNALAGAATSGVIPLLRHQTDQNEEVSKLRSYVQGLNETTKQSGVGPESGMTTSEFSGPLSYGRFPMVSSQPGYKAPNIHGKPFGGGEQQIYEGSIKTGSLIPPTAVGNPATQLAKTMRIGQGKIPTPGPSIQQVAKPKGFGLPIAGAKKNTI